jgi:urate oxidase
MAIRLGENNYGKQRVRILQVSRHADRDDIKELTLGIRLEGDFDSAHT